MDSGIDPSRVDGSLPVIVGAGLSSQRIDDPAEAQDALGLMIEAARDAVADSGVGGIVGVLDRVLVPVGRWRHGDAGRAVATAVGAPDVHSVAALPGVSQQTILSDAAGAIATGDIRAALVVGGEAGYRLQRATLAGFELADAVVEGSPDMVLRPDDAVLPHHERERGLGVMPVGYYALVASAWRRAAGLDLDAHEARMAARYAAFSRTAARNPHGWDRETTSVETIRTARLLAHPYRKHHVANWSVDQASALLVTSVGAARALEIDPAQWVFPQAFTEANHMVDVSARDRLHACVGAEIAGPACLDAAGCTVEDLDLVELYTCFPVAVEIYAAALGLPDDRPWSFTGGMPFAGGPFNNFVLHAAAQAVRGLRTIRDGRALVTTVSGVLTKQGFAVLGTRPGPDGYRFADLTDATARAGAVRRVEPDHVGTAAVAGATVVHDRAGPQAGVVVADTAAGARTVAMTTDPSLMAAMEHEEMVGRTVQVDGSHFSLVGGPGDR